MEYETFQNPKPLTLGLDQPPDRGHLQEGSLSQKARARMRGIRGVPT